METKDLKVIITGGERGIGEATARLLAAGGAKVMITDVLDTEGEALASEIGHGVVYRHHDVASAADWKAAVAAAEDAFGGLNALYSNAGVLSYGGVNTISESDFDRTIAINLKGVFLGLQTAAPALKRAGGGAIVNCSSTAGLVGYSGIAAYVASKWGVRGLTKAAALDLAPDGIRVVSIHPGPIRTPMTSGMDESMAAAQPIPRYGEPDEVARLVRFLLTEATYSTGSEFIVDGGAVTGQILSLPQ